LETLVCTTIKTIPRDQWEACRAGISDGNPFLSYHFFLLLEESKSIGPKTGWVPFYITFREKGNVVGIILSFLKNHSQGEYVFDHSWADAYQQTGGNYYPKLQVAVPFTPVSGERVLVRKGYENRIDEMISRAKILIKENNISSLHFTFCNSNFLSVAKENKLLVREGIQYHWFNRNYKSFDDFLITLTHRKRKNIKKEREQARNFGGEIKSFTGSQLTAFELESFWCFYQNTGQRKWGYPYLSKDFFMNLNKELRESVLLFMAEKNGEYVAGALNFIGSDCLYGRYWGCSEFFPAMHFELCYYKAIDFAIERGLKRVEAGAQGDHKIARGYEACLTYSSHWFTHQGFMTAVDNFLTEEKRIVSHSSKQIQFISPFKKGEK
jgi:predicted N-acyltransferase